MNWIIRTPKTDSDVRKAIEEVLAGHKYWTDRKVQKVEEYEKLLHERNIYVGSRVVCAALPELSKGGMTVKRIQGLTVSIITDDGKKWRLRGGHDLKRVEEVTK